MSPNGRRAWRRAAKKLRRKMGRKWQCSTDDRRHIKGAWFKRHGFTEQGLQKLDSPHPVRVYIGLWGTANGNGVEYAAVPKPFTTHSLVGMTMGSRKRVLQDELSRYIGDDDFDYGDVVAHFADPLRIGERLRPCPGCKCCGYPPPYGKLWTRTKGLWRMGSLYATDIQHICDGSGVLPARRSK